jgi:hypothetical protein
MSPIPFQENIASKPHKAEASAKGPFGLPIGDFGLFASVLISLASGFLAFFLTTFVGIVSILFYNTIGHHSVDFSLSYKVFALPVGLAVLAVALAVLGTLWLRRKFAGK